MVYAFSLFGIEWILWHHDQTLLRMQEGGTWCHDPMFLHTLYLTCIHTYLFNWMSWISPVAPRGRSSDVDWRSDPTVIRVVPVKERRAVSVGAVASDTSEESQRKILSRTGRWRIFWNNCCRRRSLLGEKRGFALACWKISAILTFRIVNLLIQSVLPSHLGAQSWKRTLLKSRLPLSSRSLLLHHPGRDSGRSGEPIPLPLTIGDIAAIFLLRQFARAGTNCCANLLLNGHLSQLRRSHELQRLLNPKPTLRMVSIRNCYLIAILCYRVILWTIDQPLLQGSLLGKI